MSFPGIEPSLSQKGTGRPPTGELGIRQQVSGRDKRPMIACAHPALMHRKASTDAQRSGDAGERLVAARLEASGWTILARNVRLGRDELDLVAIDPGPPPALVVLEVRRRGRRDFGLAEETLDYRKRTALRRGVGALLASGTLPDGRPLPSSPIRVDLVAVDRREDGRLSLRHHRAIRL